MFNVEYGALMNVCLSLLALFGLIINLLVLIVFYRRPTLRSPSNRFVGSLIMANLLSSTVLAPVLLSNKSSASAGLSALVVTSSVFSIVAIAADRYSAVLSPLHYANTITRRRSLAIITMSWSLAILLSSPYVLFQCAAPIFWQTHSMVLLLIGFTFPLMALVIIYSRMYTAAHRVRSIRSLVGTKPHILASHRVPSSLLKSSNGNVGNADLFQCLLPPSPLPLIFCLLLVKYKKQYNTMKVSEFEKKLQEAEFHEALGHLREITKIKDLIPFASNLEISCLMNQRLSNTEIIEFLSAVTPPPPPPVQVVAPPVVAPPAVAPPAVAPPAVAPSAVAQPVPNQTIQTLPPGFGESGGGWFFYQPPQSQAQSQSVPRNNSYNNQYNQKWPTVRGSMQRKYSRGNSRNADNNY